MFYVHVCFLCVFMLLCKALHMSVLYTLTRGNDYTCWCIASHCDRDHPKPYLTPSDVMLMVRHREYKDHNLFNSITCLNYLKSCFNSIRQRSDGSTSWDSKLYFSYILCLFRKCKGTENRDSGNIQ